MSHADYTEVPRNSLLEKTLFACDELAGFITAVTYVRPSKSIEEVEVKSVLKKMKDKAFARAVSRDDIKIGAAAIGIPLEEHIQFCIDAMKDKKELLGL
jgi:predicted hydrolase (HD superfamily)